MGESWLKRKHTVPWQLFFKIRQYNFKTKQNLSTPRIVSFYNVRVMELV